MLHLKVHLMFHVKKHEKFQKYVKKRIHFTLQLMVHMLMQLMLDFWISNLTLYTSSISYIDRSSHPEMFYKNVLLEISQNLEEDTCARVYFLIKLLASSCNFIKKETLEQVFSRELGKISKNTFLVHSEVMQFGWLRVFWPTSQEWDFSQT